MLILGNLYEQQDSLWVVVLSSIELDKYIYVKKTKVVDDIFVYQYNIEIKANLKRAYFMTIFWYFIFTCALRILF